MRQPNLSRCRFWTWLVLLSLAAVAAGAAQTRPAAAPARQSGSSADHSYVLGPGDQIVVWALGAEEISDKPVRLDTNGYIDLPLLGRLRAGGLTVEQLKAQLIERLKVDVRDPQVSVSVTDFRSQPVSVIGAVNKPGVYQVEGRKTLVEVLSMAQGLRNDAGSNVRITRLLENGRLPVPGAADDPTSKFSVAQVDLSSVLSGKSPAANLIVRPHDVISVSQAQTVYVIGEVHKSGGFVLGERDSISVLQALSLAEGVTRTAAPQRAKILRPEPNGGERTEVAVDIRRILEGKAADVPLRPNDILFVPNNKAKNAALRAAETAINIGSGIAIWRVGLPR